MGPPLAVDSHRSCILLPCILLNASFPFFCIIKNSCGLFASFSLLGEAHGCALCHPCPLSEISIILEAVEMGKAFQTSSVRKIIFCTETLQKVLQSSSSQCDMRIQNCEVLFWLKLGNLQYLGSGWELSVSPLLTHYQAVGYSEHKLYHTYQGLSASMHRNNLRTCLVILMWSPVSVHFIVSTSSYMITRGRYDIILEIMTYCYSWGRW